ncbi:flagellin N-terminal helical domain-containing protein, partial [Campylobacter canadensis]|nr:hypothetical protein [Campylobacter canadensis]
MRITSSYIYQKNLSDYQSKMYAYSKINEQLGSGLKIGQSYDDAGIYSEHIRLDYELSTFDQIIQAGESAVSFTKNSDNAVKQIKDALVSFKNKLIQSANEIHSDTSLNALANDLEKLKEHIVNLTNTSINGQYLFSGTSINTKPFDYNGNYYGNDENMKVLLGSNVYTPYNVSGSELIKATDNDYKKIVTTNVRLVDKRYDITKPEQVHYITSDNKIQDLVGKNYLKKESKDELNVNDHFLINDGAKFPDTYFYVNGTKGNGESFKAKFQMKATESVGSLLDKIGELYGNTKENTLVKVELTKTGNIEITDLKNPNSTLNFSMFAATNKADSIEEIYPDKAAQTDAEIEDIKNKAEGGAENTPMVNLKPAIKKNYADVSSLADLRAAQIKDNVDILEFTNNGNIDTSFNTDGIDYARSLFNKKDNILSSNIRQYDANNNLATDSTRLSESALSALKYHDDGNADTNSVLKIDITSRSKTRYNLEFDITKGEVRASFTKNGQAQNITLPIVNSRYDEALHKDE